MKEKVKVIAPHFAAGVAGLVLTGIAGSFGLESGYQLLLAYVLGAGGHSHGAAFIKSKMK
jgi:hypothetical protein